MHIRIRSTNKRTYLVRLSDIRRVTSQNKGCTIYFNNKLDTPITTAQHISHFHSAYLSKAFLLITARDEKQYAVRRNSVRRVYSDINDVTVVCFATKKDSPLSLHMSVKDFDIIYLGGEE